MNQRLVILGSGESGTGAALLAKSCGYDVFVSDKGAIKDNFKQELDAHGIAWEENQHTLDLILNAQEIIKSPGIPEKTELMQAIRSKGIHVIGEIEFGYRYAGTCSIVAITGSNGKTTTTELTYHLLNTAGLNVRKGGNVGNSFARMVLEDRQAGKTEDASRIFVLEVSSFQLDDIQAFRPTISMLLNITPDHLDRYEYQLDNYVRSKFRVALNQRGDDLCILNGDDLNVQAFLEKNPQAIQCKKAWVYLRDLENGYVHVGSEQAFDIVSTNLKGPHNAFNAACAIRAALALGAETGGIEEGLYSFQTPPHRLERVAEINGVTWINDSKATNVDSVFYALQAMETPVVWIVGGQDKGNDYSPLLPWVEQKVKAIVCMGVDNSKIIEAFKGLEKRIMQTGSASMAVKVAAFLAEQGDTVLLSPACASFDLFKNYEDRGEQFRHWVLWLQSIGGGHLKSAGEIKPLVKGMGGCYVSDRIIFEGEPVGYMFKEAPGFVADSGWRFMAGTESDEYINDPDHLAIYDVNTVANYDEAILPYLDEPVDSEFFRIEGSNKFRKG